MNTITLHASHKMKKTSVGEIPVEWSISKLDRVAIIQTGIAKGKMGIKDPVEMPYLRVANVQDGYFDLREVKSIAVDRSEINRYRLRSGDVLLTEGGDLDKLGRGCLWEGQIEPCLHQNHIFAVRTNPEVLLPSFFALQIAGPHGRRYFLGCAKQTTNLASINTTQLRHFPVFVPPIAEQSKISALFDVWDRAIDRLEQLIASKKQLKHGLMQQLLTGQERFKEFVGERWHTFRLGELLEPRDRYVNWSEDEAYQFASIRRRSGGLFNRGTFYGREVKTKVLKLLNADDFAISKRQVVHGAWAMVTESFDGFGVSDEYDVLVNRNPNALNMRFFSYLAQTRQLRHMALMASNGVHIEKLIFDFRHFAKLKVKMPSRLEEQTKIADLLTACDREIYLLQAELLSLQNQKRGLMQKLLTGKVRVTHLLNEST